MAVQSNRDLVKSEILSEFLISDSIIGGILAQLSENPGLDGVFNEITTAAGCELYFVPVSKIIGTHSNHNLSIREAYKLGLIAKGSVVGVKYILDGGYEIDLNPSKDSDRRVSLNDELILLADY